MLRWAGLVGCMAVLAVVAVSGCKPTTHITVVQPERTVVREVPVSEPAPQYYEAPAEAPPAPEPVVVAPAPAPVIVQPEPVMVAPAPIVVEPVVTPAVSVGFFVERLGHHGRWVSVATYGNVWVPSGVAVGWRPYSAGHWVYTDAYGWTWVSDEPFGWATYHYGRWVFLDPQGWVWVPGTVWAPAWVVWRTGGGYVGWAPMPPEAVIAPVAVSTTEVNINININIEKRIHHDHWVFVEERHVLEPVHAHIVVSKRSDWIIGVTRPSTRIVEVNGRIVNRSLAVRDVERASGRKVRTMRIREVDAGQTRDARTTVRGDEIEMPRPRLRPMADTRTTGTAGATERGTAGRRGADNAAQPSGATRGSSPRGQDAAPAPRTPVTRQPAGTSAKPSTANNGAVRTREAPSNGVAPRDATRQPAGRADAPKREPVRQPVTNAQTAPAGSARPAQVREEKYPRLDPNQVPPERSVHTMDKPAQVAPQAPARPVPAPAAPAPGAVRRIETNRERPAVRQGQDVNREDVGTKRGKAEVQPTPAPAARQPQPTPPDNERIGNVRRGADSAPKEPAANDAGVRKARGKDARPEGDVRRGRVRAADDKENDRERKVERETAAD